MGTKSRNETKRDKFVRLTEARMDKTIAQIELIGNLSDKSNYEYSEADVEKIFSRLEKEIKKAKARFCGNEESKKFKL